MKALEIIFWVMLFVVFYSYIGYGIVLRAMLWIKESIGGRQVDAMPDPLPHVTLFITAWNEEKIVESKMANCRALSYPAPLLDIVWVTDGSNDRTNELLASYPDIKVYFTPERRGKCAAMNRGMGLITTPITIFTDANTMLNAEAIREMVRPFSAPECGCVAGEKRVESRARDGAAAGGEGAYWRYESKLKGWDSRLGSCVGAAGELFAIRTPLFRELPTDTLLDDFTLSLRIGMQGYRIVYTDKAYATEGASADMKAEQKRKSRIAAGGLQAIWRLSPLLNPLKYGMLSFQYISHRVLRWSLAPLFFVALLPINLVIVALGGGLIYSIVLGLQIVYYLLAAMGYMLQSRNIRLKIVFIPYYLLFMNLNVFKGVAYLRSHRGRGSWERAARA